MSRIGEILIFVMAGIGGLVAAGVAIYTVYLMIASWFY